MVAFASYIRLYRHRLTESELTKLLGKTLTNRMLGGGGVLSVEISGLIGPQATARLFAKELSIEVVASAIRTASAAETNITAAEILEKIKRKGG